MKQIRNNRMRTVKTGRKALKLWMEIRQVDRKKGWERFEGRKRPAIRITADRKASSFGYFRWLAAAVIYASGSAAACFGFNRTKASNRAISLWDKQPRLILKKENKFC